MVASSLPLISSILLLPIISHKVSIKDFGSFSLINSLSQLFVPIFSLQLHNSILRLYYDYNDIKKNKFISSVTFFLYSYTFLVVVSIISVLYLVLNIFEFVNKTQFQYLTIGALIGAVRMLSMKNEIVLRCNDQVMKFLIASSISVIVGFYLTFQLIEFFPNKVLFLLLVTLIQISVLYVILELFVFKYYILCFEFCFVKKSLAYSLPLIISSFFTILYKRTDKILINLFLGQEFLGVFMVAEKVMKPLELFSNSIKKSIVPAFLNESTKENGLELKLIVKTYKYSTIIFSIIIILFAILCNFYISFLHFTYNSAYPYILMLLSLSFMYLNNNFLEYNVLKIKHNKLIRNIIILNFFAMLILYYIFSPILIKFTPIFILFICSLFRYKYFVFHSIDSWFIPFWGKHYILLTFSLLVIFYFYFYG